MRRVVVTGLGAVTPLGIGVRRVWSRLLDKQCGIVSTRSLGAEFEALPSQVAGIVPLEEWAVASRGITATEAKQTARFAQYSLVATAEALNDAGLEAGRGVDPDMTGVCLGSGIGNLEELYNTSITYNAGKNYRKIHPLFVPRLLTNLGAGHISMRYGFKGPNHCVTTACTTGAHSIGDGMRFIRSGDADVMIAGGAESCIHPLAIGGFARSRSLVTEYNDTPEIASRPFDKSRAGFVISEGAAVLVLEEFEHAQARGARIYAELVGYGCSADAHHLTAPDPRGAGALLAMKKALKQAQIIPQRVDYINAHATSTALGDVAECNAINELVSENSAEASNRVMISSTKGATGHLLGAAGALEALFSVLAISQAQVPPTLNLECQDPKIHGTIVAKPLEQPLEVAMTNSFGFGGTNASLVFRKVRK